MSQEQPLKYGDVFSVSGDLAKQPIAPQDAAMMQSTENTSPGHTQQCVMNELVLLVTSHDDLSDIAGDQGMTAAETNIPGKRSITGQVIGSFTEDVPRETTPTCYTRVDDTMLDVDDKITIGEALEASALGAGDKPVDQSDAAAIQAAEVRATCSNVITPGGIAAMAQSAADVNASTAHDEDKTKLSDILTDASAILHADKPVTRQDAEGIMVAELRNNPNFATHPGGVAASVVAAASINQSNK